MEGEEEMLGKHDRVTPLTEREAGEEGEIGGADGEARGAGGEGDDGAVVDVQGLEANQGLGGT